ncbi:ATP-binding protein [Croceiramulus getboli]|nr:ATP-binding protein [Flavobacteriaceae bacterium YJPT1-3]
MQCTLPSLKEIPQLAHVPDEQLDWLLSKSEHLLLKKGDYIFKRGDDIDKMIILVKGEVAIKIEQNGSYRQIATIEEKGFSGLLPYSRASSALGFGEVLRESHALILHEDHFRTMTTTHYELTEALVHVMSSRVREFAKRDVQEEKMMALGKLSAGLAHELNNPASAMVRSAKELKRHLVKGPEKFKQIIMMRLEPKQVDTVTELIFSKLNERPENKMKLLERNEKEDELTEWLEEQEVEQAYALTETLVDFCMGVPDMKQIKAEVGDDAFPMVVEWIENTLTTEKMVSEIEEASDRIANLVSSIKTYTHMDRAKEKSPADVHEGLKSTLTMLKHQLKKKNIQLDKQFDETLEPISIFVSAINQVWTNLIDNAIDAMDEGGTLKITTLKEHDSLRVDIADDGSGIPEEDIDRIFDPFYTTKAVGKGTGMGLEVVQRIVRQHQGSIKVKSKPGETVFTVCLPYETRNT